MDRYCLSCGAPVGAESQTPYCQYCVDADGKLKPHAEVKAGVEQWLKSWAPQGSAADFGRRAESYLQAMPAWRGAFVELVRFRVRPGVEAGTVLEAAEEANTFLRQQEGFVQRHLGQSEDGVWHDIVLWRNREDLERAMPLAAGSAHCARFFGLIDQGNDTMALFPAALTA